MPRRVLETLTGVGDVYAGDVLLRRTHYDLTFWTDDTDGAQLQRGSVRVDGHIDISGMGEAVVLAGADRLTLQLEDGRRLSIRLTGSGGSIVGSV
jgi:hypothetical protein